MIRRLLLWFIAGILLGWWSLPFLFAAAPTRDNTYIEGTEIEPDDVMNNEDAILEYLQNGVDTYAANSITTAAIATGAVTSNDILDGTITSADLAFTLSNQVLPAGAVFFMFTGSCPSWTTDVTSTYSNLFIRVNATQLSTGGSTSHTHAVGSYVAPSHTHTTTVPGDGWGNNSGDSGYLRLHGGVTATESAAQAGRTFTSSSSGTGAVTGTSASTDHVPSFVGAILCRVN